MVNLLGLYFLIQVYVELSRYIMHELSNFQQKILGFFYRELTVDKAIFLSPAELMNLKSLLLKQLKMQHPLKDP
jgi:hypothetical protein